MGSQP